MIEVEIRGELTKEKFLELNKIFSKTGQLIENQDREMVRLFGFSENEEDIVKRSLDVRIRVTNGNSEIMVKKNLTGDNLARKERSFSLSDLSLDKIKELVKVFGFSEGRWMHRKKMVYIVSGFEWSLVEAVPDIYYFEIEKEAESENSISEIKGELVDEIKKFNLAHFSDEEYVKFIDSLNAKVNKVISW